MHESTRIHFSDDLIGRCQGWSGAAIECWLASFSHRWNHLNLVLTGLLWPYFRWNLYHDKLTVIELKHWKTCRRLHQHNYSSFFMRKRLSHITRKSQIFCCLHYMSYSALFHIFVYGLCDLKVTWVLIKYSLFMLIN